MGRAYTQQDLKVLWGAHARCAFPDCRTKLIVDATDVDPAKPIGKICHIIASSDDGPRGDPSFPGADRDLPSNLILLCGTHHDVIDVQPNTYTSEEIKRWKSDHESWVEDTLSDAVAALTFAELEQAVASLLATPGGITNDLTPPTPPKRKMEHNELTSAVAPYYRIGQMRFHDVEAYIDQVSGFDTNFGERLKAGFQAQYEGAMGAGSSGGRSLHRTRSLGLRRKRRTL